MFKLLIGCLVTALALVSAPLTAQQLPWYSVPVEYGVTGQYACVTQNQPFRGPLITCNPSALAQMSPGAQTFLLAHEHGHVFQLMRGQQFAQNPEADADCYAAKYLAVTNPQALADALNWLQKVLGPRGGDMTHGNGIQIAAWARRCAGW
jgi:hypothetical protein